MFKEDGHITHFKRLLELSGTGMATEMVRSPEGRVESATPPLHSFTLATISNISDLQFILL